jgi:RNA-dependent RNA polymerase
VVIFSTKGARSPLSLLGGGDYDGDTVIVIWEPEIVGSFNNAPLDRDGLCQGDPPADFIEKNFDKSAQRLSNYINGMPADQGEVTRDLQKWLLAPLVNESVVGYYSIL